MPIGIAVRRTSPSASVLTIDSIVVGRSCGAAVDRQTTASVSVPAARVPVSEIVSLNVPCVLRLISNRKLRWAGHVARMDMHRLPRKFLSSWVKDVPRPRRRAQSYGHDLSRELNGIGFNLLTGSGATMLGVSRDWLTVAQDRACLACSGGTSPPWHVPCGSESHLQSKSTGRGQSELQSAPLRGFDPRH